MNDAIALSAAEERRRLRIVALWLIACCLLVYAMVVLGGVTRLTGSGLSIVEWRPVTGVIPPFSEAAWLAEFDKYRASPEYQHVNRGMSLLEFQFIYWFEYAHRLLGRLIGLVFALPLAWFAWRRWIHGTLSAQLVALLVLGAAQGALGWYMVASGLVDEPRVSQYRLTAHLMLAVVIYAWMLVIALSLLFGGGPGRRPLAPAPGSAANALFALAVAVMIASGGMMAGTRAGHVFNTFPLMNGDLLPAGLLALEPAFRNLAENVVTIQFIHRWLAMLVLAFGLWLWWRYWRTASERALRVTGHAALVVLGVQVSLGIFTLLAGAPLPLAAAHQGVGLLLLTCAIVLWQARRWRPTRAGGVAGASAAAVSSPARAAV